MEIELKTGEKLILEVTPLLLEYIEDYEGGIKKLREDAEGKKDENGYSRTMYATNHLLYAMIASNYDKELLTYRQAVKLVKLEDVDKVIDFAAKNIPALKGYKRSELMNKTHRM